MAINPDDIDALPDYTATQQLKMWKKASIDLAASGVSYAVNGRSLTRSDGKEVREQIAFWEQRVADEDAGANGGGIVLVKFGEAQ